MSAKPRDPLLATSRLLLVISMATMVATVIACALGVPGMLIFRGSVAHYFAGQGAPPDAIWAIVTVSGLVGTISGLGFFFLRHLYRIVGTVGDQDPFVPINAERLSAMGWISLATQVLAIPLFAIGHWLLKVTNHVRVEPDVALSGVLLTVILFILARVFREGTRMRDELEGTV